MRKKTENRIREWIAENGSFQWEAWGNRMSAGLADRVERLLDRKQDRFPYTISIRQAENGKWKWKVLDVALDRYLRALGSFMVLDSGTATTYPKARRDALIAAMGQWMGVSKDEPVAITTSSPRKESE